MNSTREIQSKKFKWYDYLIGYFPFVIIFLGVTGNPFTLIVIRTNKFLKKQSSMMVFSFISILDLLSLFTWNLDSYFKIFYGFSYEDLSLLACRFMAFLQYFGLHSSALLLSFISIDRYFTIISKPGSLVSKLPFGTPRTSFIWSLSITITSFLFNSHILILNGYKDQPKYSNQTIELEINGSLINKTQLTFNYSSNIHCYSYSASFHLSPFYDIIKMTVFSILPFTIMVFFNSSIIFKVLIMSRILNRNDVQSIKSYRKKLKMTISLLAVTFLFLIITLPNTIYFGFFYSNYKNNYIINAFDHLLFLHQSTLFFSLFFTNIYFRKAVLNFCWQKKTK